MKKAVNILLVDDENGFRETVAEKLNLSGYSVDAFSSSSLALNKTKEKEFSVAVVDIIMPEMDGLTLLSNIKEIQPLLEVIIITGQGSIESAINAIKKGAYNYLTKPVKLAELEIQIKKAYEKHMLSKQNILHITQDKFKAKFQYNNIVAESSKMKEVIEVAIKVASYDSSVLIEGETGTGKEIIANLIHRESPRKDKPFIVINCGSLPESMLERELFGHSKGSFTGASESKPGLIEVADEGTLFLDEIGELSMSGQISLLRVLETGNFRRLGETREVNVDVRIISATNKNLSNLTQENKFRLDLYHRLNVIHIYVPTLRERKEDIQKLSELYMDKFSKMYGVKKIISHSAIDILMNYNWPGNVRELFNVLERVCLICNRDEITASDLSFPLGNISYTEKEFFTLDEAEKRHILATLKSFNFDKEKTAKALGISLRHLYRKLDQYKINSTTNL